MLIFFYDCQVQVYKDPSPLESRKNLSTHSQLGLAHSRYWWTVRVDLLWVSERKHVPRNVWFYFCEFLYCFSNSRPLRPLFQGQWDGPAAKALFHQAYNVLSYGKKKKNQNSSCYLNSLSVLLSENIILFVFLSSDDIEGVLLGSGMPFILL